VLSVLFLMVHRDLLTEYSVLFAGTPNLNFFEAMRAEHCSRFGWDQDFTTSNYNVTTTPEKEWRIVVNQEEFLADKLNGRRLVNIEEVMRSDAVQSTKVSKEEIVAVVLYTGPMVSEVSFVHSVPFYSADLKLCVVSNL
jgi:hypothetical protein